MAGFLDDLDRRILDVAQSGFPLAHRPYAVIADALGIEEEDVYERISRMRDAGIIRRIGANFQSTKLGFVSTLCAASVPGEKLDAFIELVNAEAGVTHNYLRAHRYNVWFTLISEGSAERERILEKLSSKSGIRILNLPASKLFKIRVDFPMEGE